LTGLLGLGALLGFTTAWYQLAPLLLLAAAAAIMVAAPLVGGFRIGVRTLVASAIAIVIAAVLLVPWSVALLGAGDDPASLGFSFRPHLDLVDVLRFHSGPAGGGWAAWGFVAAGALALIVGRGPRFTWATRAAAAGMHRTAIGRRRWHSCRRSGTAAASGCCGWETRVCSRWIRSWRVTGPATRSPGTAPVTRGSCGGPRPAGPTASSATRS